MLTSDAALVAALADSRRLGMLGGRSIAEVIEHAEAFVGALTGVTGTVVDLGSGGGVPGLVIARARPDLRLVLVDRRESRTDQLCRLVGRLGLADQVEVLTLDAAALGERLPTTVDAVVARGFGSPDATLRAAAPLLRTNGLVVVSEPPSPRRSRWPGALLAGLDLVPVAHADRRVAVFRKSRAAHLTGDGMLPPGPGAPRP